MSNYSMPNNEELIKKAEKLLCEPIPKNSDDKYALYKRLDAMFNEILNYRNEYIDAVVKDTLNPKLPLEQSVTIALCPQIETTIDAILKRQQDIYKIHK